MNIEIICPLYNAESYILDLDASIMRQKKVQIDYKTYLVTESKDNTEKILKKNKIKYKKIKKQDFSHSLTREKYAL